MSAPLAPSDQARSGAPREARAALEAPAAATGAAFIHIAQTLGGMGVLLGQLARRGATWPPALDYPELRRNLHKMAVKSLPIVVVTALFTGVITVIQAAPVIKRYGAEGLLGWGAGFATIREIAPLLTALMISGRVGANNTAELGTMVVTEQIDALRALAIDPVAFLVLPRFLAIIVTLVSMTLYADAVALLGAAFSGFALLQIEPRSFYNGLTGGLLNFGDVANGLTKSLVFGLVIALSSCHFGMTTTGGAPGVGRSVNASVVASAAGVFILDYFVSFILG
ncbi:MAG TPA: ABC transporter permease [Polyangiaceae bacterium]|nr:ABC transporter permease [Polyangiaceae bacterium]